MSGNKNDDDDDNGELVLPTKVLEASSRDIKGNWCCVTEVDADDVNRANTALRVEDSSCMFVG